MIYTATSMALAILETVANVDVQDAPSKLALIELHLRSDLVAHMQHTELPPDWDAVPARDATRTLGTNWALGKSSLAFSLPSALFPDFPNDPERVVLINPQHPDAKSIVLVCARHFSLDPVAIVRPRFH